LCNAWAFRPAESSISATHRHSGAAKAAQIDAIVSVGA
jgi:hypothetical protein